jgi:hypothetical protein
MTRDLPLVHSSTSLDQSTELSQVFRHPQGLVAARAIAKSLIIQSQRSAQPIDPSPPQTTSSSSLGFQSTPGVDPDSTNMLNNLLAFSDNQSQTPGEGSDVAQLVTSDPRGESHEAPDRCTLSPLITSFVPPLSTPKLTAVTAAHVALSSSAAAPLGHHGDPFSCIEDNGANNPNTEPYLPTPIRALPDIRAQTRPLGHAMDSNSLTPRYPGDSSVSAPRPNNIWVAQEFSRAPLPTQRQSNPSIPPPNFFELRHCTFTSITSSQTTMDPTGAKSTLKKRKFISGEDKTPKRPRKAKKNKSKTEKKESVIPHTISPYITLLTMNEGF